MTKFPISRSSVAALLFAAMLACAAAEAKAQCATCATPTVAYSPVVAAPTVVYDGWYPGKLFDRFRLRRWTAAYPAAPVYTAAYAPYTAAYTPYVASYAAAPTCSSCTAGYAPYTAGYATYVTAYAPLQTAVVQTSYLPAASCDSCSSCAQTVHYSAELSPVVPACSSCAPAACSCESGCSASGCSACSSCGQSAAVDQAAFSVPASSCSSCAASQGQVIYSGPSGSSAPGGVNVGPQTPQPGLGATEPVPDPANSQYDANRVPAPAGGIEANGTDASAVDPGPAPEDNGAAEPTTYFRGPLEAPQLLSPTNDRTANRPTVDVHHAVYRQPVRDERVSTVSAKPVVAKTQAEIDAEGWESVSR